MAINVNTVYQTVLLILNKEQRGLLTPDEFSKIATQVQLEIFEQYFYDLNQFSRIPKNGKVNSNMVSLIEEKISLFEKSASITEEDGSHYNLPSDLYRLNNVFLQASRPDDFVDGNEAELVSRKDFLKFNKSKLTAPTETNPVYIQSENKIEIFPRSVVQGVTVYYVKTPSDVRWDFEEGNFGEYIFKPSTAIPSNTVDFELAPSEQTEVVLRVLKYAGVIIQNPQVVQVAASEIAQNEANQKR